MGFDTFLGNPQAVRPVRQMLASERVPGALLFSGPDGVGKKTLALMLAKALNCERRKPGGDDFCGECARCRKADQMIQAAREDLARRREMKEAARRVEGLVYFDLQLIEPITRYILVEQVRRMRAIAYTHPFELPRRVFVIDPAQALHWQAADLLLKVLEEPPDTSTFILISTNASELRATIRSRCQQVRFRPVEDAIISRLLGKERRFAGEPSDLVTRLAQGSIARARTLDLEDYRRRRQPWLDYLEALSGHSAAGQRSPDWGRLFEATRALGREREEFEEALRIGYSLLRDLAHLVVGANPGVVNSDLLPRLQTWSSRLGFPGIARLKQGLDEAYRLQIRNANPQMGLDALAVETQEAATR